MMWTGTIPNTEYTSTGSTFTDDYQGTISYYTYVKTIELPNIHRSKHGPDNKRKHYQEIQKRHERRLK
jgi:hypothetical protein